MLSRVTMKKFKLSCSSNRRRSVWPDRDWRSDVRSNDRVFGPSWASGSAGLAENTVWRTAPAESRIWTRNSWPGSANWVAAFWMRSDQFRIARATTDGTTKAWLMLRTPPAELISASNDPEIGGRAVAGPGGSNVPLFATQLPAGDTVHPVRLPVSKLPLVMRLTPPGVLTSWPRTAARCPGDPGRRSRNAGLRFCAVVRVLLDGPPTASASTAAFR